MTSRCRASVRVSRSVPIETCLGSVVKRVTPDNYPRAFIRVRHSPLPASVPLRYPAQMRSDPHIPRSPELMSRQDSALLVVDVQDKLIGLIPGHERIVWN